MAVKVESLLFSVLRNGNEKEIREQYENIYKNYYKLVYFCVAKYINNEETIKDLTNESFLLLFENIEKVNSNVKYYLLTTAKNVAKAYLKNNNNIIIVEDSLLINIPYNNTKSNEVYSDLINDMKKVLTEREVEIIIFHIIDEMSFKELEKKYNIKAKTINKIYERAIKKFRTSERSRFYEK